ncbi:uncharacterized protein [Fopius arisanus]|uniref:Exonuclease domain-containing protein n=1 Tax=Fopius arisanus TaxID=64838 RepID=A0A9R1T3N7_9HYME|nr:PREDICTED: uncharacterized protein LOC105266044 [Fopius arisanus]
MKKGLKEMNKHCIDKLNCDFTYAMAQNTGASSQHESLNATMASKAPKSRCYGTSESADFRYGCAVSRKNVWEKYIEMTKEKLGLKPAMNTPRHVSLTKKTARIRSEKSKTKEFKNRRNFLWKQKTMLRNKKEASEGDTYNTNMGFLTTSAVEHCPLQSVCFEREPGIVFFDLETSGFGKSADILQIAAKCQQFTFSRYITSTQNTSPQAFEGHLFYNGNCIVTKSPNTAYSLFCNYLRSLRRRSIICAHNAIFNVPRLLRGIANVGMCEELGRIIEGFSDTLPIIRLVRGKKGRGENTLSQLAKLLEINTDGTHNAIQDVRMLERVTGTLEISHETLVTVNKTWNACINGEKRRDVCSMTLKTLAPLKDHVSAQMRKKMAESDISFEILCNTFRTHQENRIKTLLAIDENGIVRVTKSKRIGQSIVDFLKKVLGEI